MDDGETFGTVGEGGEIEEAGPSRAMAYAYLLAKGASEGNHTAGLMDGGEKGEYLGGSALWKPSLRLDPNWAETMRRRSRKEAKERIAAVIRELPDKETIAMRQGYRHRLGWKLLTLTMPHPEGANTLDQIRLFNAAFRRMTKREEWRKVYAGVKGIEDKLTAKGPHVHAHFLILSRYLDKQAWRNAWGECLDASAAEIGYQLDYGSDNSGADGLPVVDIKQIVKTIKVGMQEVATWETALEEVSKYITKTSDLLEPDKQGRTVSPETLLELCDIKRWPRMFELLGKARRPRQTPQAACLDTSCISAAATSQTPAAWIQERLEGFKDASEELRSDPEKVTHRVIKEKKKDKVASWRELIGVISWDEWRKVIDERVRRGAAFRLRWLKTHMPTLFLVNLRGEVIANQCPGYDLA